MKTLLTLCCFLFSAIALATESVDLTIDNQTSSVFQVDFKGRDTTISKIDKIKSYEKVTITMTTEEKYPVGTFLLKPDWIGITVTADKNLVVTSCDSCDPPSWVTKPIEKNKATVVIK